MNSTSVNSVVAEQSSARQVPGQVLTAGEHQIKFGNKLLKLLLSSRAARAMAVKEQKQHIDVELELYFSCLIRKRVNIREQARTDAIIKMSVNDFLSISFRPVMTKVCRVSDVKGEPDIESLPIVKPERYTPNWLSLDFKGGQWLGEFGY